MAVTARLIALPPPTTTPPVAPASNDRSYRTQRDAVVAAGAEIVDHGVLSHSGHGNFSVRLDGDRMLLTPSGFSRGLEPGDLAVVGFDGAVERGRLTAATREIVPMHVAATGLVPTSRRWSTPTRPASGRSPWPTVPCRAATRPCSVVATPRRCRSSPGPLGAPMRRPVASARRSLAPPRPWRSSSPTTVSWVFGASDAAAAAVLVALEVAAGAELLAAAIGGTRDFPEGAVDDVRRSMARFTPAGGGCRDHPGRRERRHLFPHPQPRPRLLLRSRLLHAGEPADLDVCRMQRWLDIEVALARSQADLGLIPTEAADEIARAARLERIDLEAVRVGILRTEHSLVPLLGEAKKVCAGDAGEYLHYGATTQDIIDTGLILEMRAVLDVAGDELDRLVLNQAQGPDG